MLNNNGDKRSGETVIPLGAQIVSVVGSNFTIIALVYCITCLVSNVVKWTNLPPATWLTLGAYIDSLMFAFATAALRYGVGVNRSSRPCQAAVFMCLFIYFGTKLLLYLYFVERAYLVRGGFKDRFKDFLYLFNAFGVLILYLAGAVALIVWRKYIITREGSCKIGFPRAAVIVVASYDGLVNVYLTSLFLTPLRQLYSYKSKSNPRLRTMALKTFIGSCITLVIALANISIMAALKNELAWLCLMLCNFDIFLSSLVLHWISERKPSTATPVVSTPAIPFASPAKESPNLESMTFNSISSSSAPLPSRPEPKGRRITPPSLSGIVTTEITGGLQDSRHRSSFAPKTIRVEESHKRNSSQKDDLDEPWGHNVYFGA